MVDLFSGRFGWSKGFIANGWRCQAYDINQPSVEVPEHVEFIQADVLELTADDLRDADFICCSSPCEEFSVHCMKHFHPNPKFPALGIKLFNHSREICEASGKPYIMENVRCAEKFVGRAVNHCGPFYLWGSGVPAVMPKESFKVQKGCNMGHFGANGQALRTMTREAIREARRKSAWMQTSSHSKARKEMTSRIAEIPSLISNYVAATFSANGGGV